MKQLIKLNFEIMGRSMWIETLESDQDPNFIKKKADIALSLMLKQYNSIPNITPTEVSEEKHDTKKLQVNQG